MYPGDLTGARWVELEPLLKPLWGSRDAGGRPRKYPLRRVYDAGKRIEGRKRHIAVDTQGNLPAVLVHSAGICSRFYRSAGSSNVASLGSTGHPDLAKTANCDTPRQIPWFTSPSRICSSADRLSFLGRF